MIRNILIFKNMKCLVNWSNATKVLSDLLIGYISAMVDIATKILNERLLDIRLEHTTIFLATYGEITIATIYNHENYVPEKFQTLSNELCRTFRLQFNEYLELSVFNTCIFKSFHQIIEKILHETTSKNMITYLNGGGS